MIESIQFISFFLFIEKHLLNYWTKSQVMKNLNFTNHLYNNILKMEHV